MNVIRTLTLRQMRAARARTLLTFLETAIASGLLTAVLLGGLSFANTIGPDNYDPFTLARLVRDAAAVVAVLLLFASSFLIGSAFSVSLSGRVRALGLLASAGATRRQLRASVWWEALLLGAAAIPAGMALAVLGLLITFSLLGRSEAVVRLFGPLRLSVSVPGLLFCALWSGLMLFFAACGPARAAFRVQPVETFSPARRARRAKRARPWRFGKPLAPQLAKRGAAQDGARHRALCAGMAVSLALIVVCAGLSGAIRYAYRMSAQPYDCRWYVYGANGSHPREVLDEAARLFPQIPSLRAEFTNSVWIHDAGKPSEKAIFEQLIVLEDADFAAWYGALLAPEERTVPYVLSQSDSVIPQGTEWDGIKESLGPVYLTAAQRCAGLCAAPLPLHAGERGGSMLYYDVYLAAVTNRTAFDYAFCDTPIGLDRNFAVYYGTHDAAPLAAPLRRLGACAGVNLRDALQDHTPTSEWATRRRAVTLLVDVFGWGFTVLVLLAVLVSLMGTVGADLALHRRETGLLRSAGMTQRQLRALLRSRCFSYCAGLPFGAVLAMPVCGIIASLLRLPLLRVFRPAAALAGAALLAGACLLALYIARKSLSRRSLAELLRKEE